MRKYKKNSLEIIFFVYLIFGFVVLYFPNIVLISSYKNKNPYQNYF